MSILVLTESENGKLKKSAYEVVSYAKALAAHQSTTVTAIAINCDEPSELGNFGADKVLNTTLAFSYFDALIYSEIVTQAAKQEGSNLVIISSSANAKYMAGMLASKLDAGYVSNVVDLPDFGTHTTVKRTAFSNKAFSHTTLNADMNVLGLSTNAFGATENQVTAEIVEFQPDLPDQTTTQIDVSQTTGKASIADADIVVSAGRGLKGPENWGIIEEMAEVLGAATACSKPVSDMGWRPHSEHVGQTGKPVATNLYFAIGISGAIQHLAGINASKIKVVINTDPEAPFFKAADYGIVGDAFDVVPRLTEKLKALQIGSV
jgi:electron transfer flavoprotein alpha subunit